MTIQTDHTSDTLTPTGGTLAVSGGATLTTALPVLSGGTGSSTSGGALTNLGAQATLVSGTNIKTVNGSTLLGSGDLTVSASAGGSNTQVQYNNTGALAGSASLTWDGTTLKASNVEATGGLLVDGNFGGTFTDGVVVDYDSVGSAGRISVGTGDSLGFYNGGVAGTLLATASSSGNWTFYGNLKAGNGTLVGGATNPLIEAAGSAAGYVQVYVHNDNSGTSASSDLAAYPDNGADATGWIDMGITSSTYADAAFPITTANEGYLLMSNPSTATTATGNLVYATDSTGTTNAHQWYVGGFTVAKSAWKMQLSSTALTTILPIVSTVATGTAPFTVASTTQVANLNAATAGTATSATTATNLAGGALGSVPYQNAAGTTLFLAGNTTTTPQFVTSTGAAGVATAPTLTSSTGSGSVVLATSPTLVTPALGTPASGVVTNLTGTASININGTVGATTPAAGKFTTITQSAGTAGAGGAPIYLTSGTNLTTAAAGAFEYDGNTPYFSVAASTRGVLRTEQWVVLTSTNTLTSQTGVQPIFDGGGGPTNGSVTLPIGTYQFECVYALTAMSATSGSFGFALGGGATFTYSYDATASKAGTAAATSQAGFKLFSSAAATALVTNSTGTVGSALIKGIIRVTAAGTIIPQVSLTQAAAAIVSANSYFKVSPLGNVSTVATVGNWA